MKIGEWVGVSADGLWFCMVDENKYTFKTKKELIEDISSAKLDARRTPKVKRFAEGVYEYSPKDCDTGTFGDTFEIIKLTNNNIDNFKTLAKEQLEEEEE